MTPELQRAIGLLKLSNTELAQELTREAEANPALVVTQAAPDVALALWEPTSRPKAAPVPLALGIGGGLAETLGVAGSPGLQEHILTELRLLLRDAEDLQIGAALALAVSPWGWLERTPAEIADEIGAPVARVEAVLARAQQIEPAGLLARDLRECLWLQLRERNALSPAMEVVLNNLALLGSGKLADLAERAGTTEPDILALLRVIRSLDPKPGLQFDPAPPPIAEPDILVRRKAGGWAVALNRSTLPEVSIDTTRALTQRRAAELLARAVTRRNETLLRLASEIVERQKAWLEHGPAQLAPMSYAALAQATGLHETTVGRLAAGRMMATPRGTVTLRALCSAAIATQNGGAVSAVALRHRIAAMIANEGRSPLSDTQIAQRLAADGLSLSRRTVTKYRALMGIACAAERGMTAQANGV